MISTGAPLQQLLREIRSRRHCVVCGGPGCGKTTLLKVATTELRREGIGVGYTFCGFTAKSLVRSAAQNLLQVHGTELGIRPPEQKEILAGTKLALRNFLIDQCGRRTIVLIVDPVGRLTKPYKCLIEVLMEHCTVVTSTETTDAYVGLFFWNFSKVKLENWTQSESFRANRGKPQTCCRFLSAGPRPAILDRK